MIKLLLLIFLLVFGIESGFLSDHLVTSLVEMSGLFAAIMIVSSGGSGSAPYMDFLEDGVAGRDSGALTGDPASAMMPP
jgi:hypothetical protein